MSLPGPDGDSRPLNDWHLCETCKGAACVYDPQGRWTCLSCRFQARLAQDRRQQNREAQARAVYQGLTPKAKGVE